MQIVPINSPVGDTSVLSAELSEALNGEVSLEEPATENSVLVEEY